MDSAITVNKLRKTYGSLVAVDGISFEVGSGEIFGMVGPNGAGKTTTIESLEGIRSPDAGEVRILGLDPRRDAYTVGMVLYFPNLFLSGATLPKEMFPPVLRSINQVLPLTHVVSLLQGLWFGEPWSKHMKEVLVLGGLLVVGAVLSARTFRWE